MFAEQSGCVHDKPVGSASPHDARPTVLESTGRESLTLAFCVAYRKVDVSIATSVVVK